MTWRLLAATAALIACGGGESKPASSTPPGATPPPVMDANVPECRSNSDCVITDQVTCCSPCPDDPQPMSKRRLAEINHNCAAESCPSIGDKECEKPKSMVGLVAVCRVGNCDVKSTPASPGKK